MRLSLFCVVVLFTYATCVGVLLNDFSEDIVSQSESLRRQVTRLREQRHVDFVFLIDSSASVGAVSFDKELRFVIKLLSSFPVSSQRGARIAIVVYSSRSRVRTHVNSISGELSAAQHKCSLLPRHIHFSGGGTFTLGALQTAEEILDGRVNKSRPAAIFLVTDGYSNGGDPRPLAKRLKANGVSIFTFGVRNGNVPELLEMASSREHCFIVESFEAFEALARRGLHEDLSVEDYDMVGGKECDSLCDSNRRCCHSKAKCACGLHSGRYACLCPKGHYGSGLRNQCHPCPNNTYQPTYNNGGIDICTPCPDAHHISPPGSSSVAQCTCQAGFVAEANGHNNFTYCKAVECAPISVPENGYVVNRDCGQAYHTACGIRCNSGYTLKGASIRICGDGGIWSGEDPVCERKSCRPLAAPINGQMNCSTKELYFETECNFTCDEGFLLIGSRRRTCLPIALWDGLQAFCRPISCNPIIIPQKAKVIPASCAQGKSPYGAQCQFICEDDTHRLNGPNFAKCTAPGVWSNANERTLCIDTRPPTIECPDDIKITTDQGLPYATVDWEVPESSRPNVVIEAKPSITPPDLFFIGSADITYVARDPFGNMAQCRFTVTIFDAEAPTVDRCISPPVQIARAGQLETVVHFAEPQFTDNSAVEVSIESSHKSGDKFPHGVTQVTFVATDDSGNNATCHFNVEVREHFCQEPQTKPMFGNVSCSRMESGLKCDIYCKKGYTFIEKTPLEYTCSETEQIWTPDVSNGFPDCAALMPLKNVANNAVEIANTTDTCNDEFLIKILQQTLKKRVTQKALDKCRSNEKCRLQTIDIICNNKKFRQRRSLVATNFPDPEKMAFETTNSLMNFSDLSEDLDGDLLISMDDLLQVLEADINDPQDLNSKNSTSHVVKISQKSPFQCEMGSVPVGTEACAKCPIGMFHNFLKHACVPCNQGTYQFKEGELSCLICPNKTSTTGIRSKSIEECKAQCLPGTFSTQTGLVPCETCRLGDYQPLYGQMHCLSCPSNMLTLRRGTFRKKDCIAKCRPGYVSRTGVENCVQCPKGYYQPLEGQKACVKCAGIFHNETHCTPLIMGNETLILLPVNDCFSNPCENGGSCIHRVPRGFECKCLPGYVGARCQINIDFCLSQPCGYGATCHSEVAGFRCICPPGYTGPTCSDDVNECVGVNPCFNGGLCVNYVGTFGCECISGFTGSLCEDDVNECQTGDVCPKSTDCVNLHGSFTCNCSSSSSVNCEDEIVTISECDSDTKSCLNGGSCVDVGANTSRCVCFPGYGGARCEMKLDPCSSSPCLHPLSRCVNQVEIISFERENNALFVCICPPGYSGSFCEKEAPTQFILDYTGNSTSDCTVVKNVGRFTAKKNLREFTVCLWLKSSDLKNYGTPFSYATSDADNMISLTDYNGLVLYVRNERIVTDLVLNDNVWHHVCVQWSSKFGQYAMFEDGKLLENGTGLAVNTTVTLDGTIVLGQDQDQLATGFSPSEAFSGLLSQVYMWTSRLKHSDIETLATSCGEIPSIKEAIVVWSDFLADIRGNVTVRHNSYCLGCSPPQAYPGTNVVVDGTSPGCTANYSCADGFVEALYSKRCLPAGEWSGKQVECKPIRCPIVITNATLIWSSSKLRGVNTVEKYACPNGTILLGADIVRCTARGDWDASVLPYCVNATTGDDSSSTFYETPCEDIENIPFGSLVPLDEKYSRVVLTCQEGYQFFPNTTSLHLRCDNVTWTVIVTDFAKNNNNNYIFNESITCKPVNCYAEEISGVWKNDSRSWIPVETSVLHKCIGEGFVLVGHGVRRCKRDGNWNYPLPTCRRIACENPIIPLNGRLLFSNNLSSVNGTLTLKCNEGYEAVGHSSQTCNSSGLWTPLPLGHCRLIKCKLPPVSISHAKIEQNISTNHYYSLGEMINYQCLPGYSTSYPIYRFCTRHGNWSELLTDQGCHRVLCDIRFLPVVSHANAVLQNKISYAGLDVRYQCKEGFHVLNATSNILATTRCLSNASWSAVNISALCVPVTCAVPENISSLNGLLVRYQSLTVGSTIEFSCEAGYKLNGNRLAKCLLNGKWSKVFPNCTSKRRCPQLKSLLNGNSTVKTFATSVIAEFFCIKGFVINGSGIIFCNATLGKWSALQPSCIPAQCPTQDKLHLLKNGRIAASSGVLAPKTSYTPGDVLHLECEEGFRMQGPNKWSCSDNGTWIGRNVTKCQKVQCPKPEYSTAFAAYRDYSFGSSIEYSCNAGHLLLGSKRRTCLANSKWSAPVPICIAAPCPQPLPPSPPLNAALIQNGTLVYSCTPPFILRGVVQRECTPEGVWKGDEPSCENANAIGQR